MDATYRRWRFPLMVTLLLLALQFTTAQTRTVGVLSMTTDTAAGYTLFTPMYANGTYLIDNFGRLINSWSSDKNAGLSVYLLPDGSILRCESMQNRSFNSGGSGGRIKRTSWDGQTIWTYDYSSSSHCQHHDCEYLPNGNVLIIAWEVKSQSEAGATGRNTSNSVWSGHILEVKPSGANGGEIVWEWHVWDHLIQDKDQSKDNYGVVADHPELIDVNYVEGAEEQMSPSDWLHTNNVDYNEDLDQILLSVRYFSEVWIIDHSTTTAEAASHSGGRYGRGGDLLYRFGNPAAYKSGSNADRQLYLQHDAHWIPAGRPGAGNILIFNNGGSSRRYSSVDEFTVPVDASGNYDLNEKPEQVWSYTFNGFFSSNMSSAQRMANGNTLICYGTQGAFYEVDSEKDRVWEYMSPVTSSGITRQYQSLSGGMGMAMNRLFRTYRYAPDYAAFEGRNLTAGDPLEGGELVTVERGKTTTVSSSGDGRVSGEFTVSSYANSTSAMTISVTIPRNTEVTLKMYTPDGREIATLVNQYLSAGNHSYTWSPDGYAGGIYFVRLTAKKYATAHRVAVLR